MVVYQVPFANFYRFRTHTCSTHSDYMHLCCRMVLELSERFRNARSAILVSRMKIVVLLFLASSDASISMYHILLASVYQVLLVLKIKYIHAAVSAIVLHLVASYYLLRHTLHLYLIHVAIMFCGLVLYMYTVALLFIFL